MENSEQFESNEFLPKYEPARLAVERARKIVKENNEMISRMKSEFNIDECFEDSELQDDAENFSYSDSYAFDLYKIKSSNNVLDTIKDMLGVH